MIAHTGPLQLAACCLLLATTQVAAFEFGDSVTFSTLIAASVQCQVVQQGDKAADTCRAAAPLQPEFELRPTVRDKL